MRHASIPVIVALFTFTGSALLAGCGSSGDAPVRATLQDGQILYGDLRTDTLVLEGALGTLEIPLEDVGEVVPVEGTQLDDSDGHVKVWLRNGSELAGKWNDPELTMGIEVGDTEVRVDLPVGDLQRMQTRAGEIWTEKSVYRIRTSHGDDFLVDAETSRIAIESDLGEFKPFLSECESIRPIDGPQGDWRIQLTTGTVLIGKPANDELTLMMPMGPQEVTVPLASLLAMEQQQWYAASHGQQVYEPTASAEPRRKPGRRGLFGGKRDRAMEADAVTETAPSSYAAWDGAGAGGMGSTSAPMAAPVERMAEEATDTPEMDEDASRDPVVADEEGWFRRDALEQSKRAAE